MDVKYTQIVMSKVAQKTFLISVFEQHSGLSEFSLSKEPHQGSFLLLRQPLIQHPND
jgi:hypothetical protein